MTSRRRTTTSPGEALAVTTICFGWAIIASAQSVAASSHSRAAFNDAGFIGLVALELVCASIALVLLHFRKYSVASLYPAPSVNGMGSAVLLLGGAWLVGWLLTAPFAANVVEQPIDQMVQGASVSMPILVLLALVNGTYEEVFLLGFLMRGLRGYGLSVAIALPLLVRVLYHLYQGPLGALSIFGFGVVLSLHYARTGSLFAPVFAHVLADIVPFVW